MTKAQINIMNPYIGTHFVDIYSCIKLSMQFDMTCSIPPLVDSICFSELRDDDLAVSPHPKQRRW